MQESEPLYPVVSEKQVTVLAVRNISNKPMALKRDKTEDDKNN